MGLRTATGVFPFCWMGSWSRHWQSVSGTCILGYGVQVAGRIGEALVGTVDLPWTDETFSTSYTTGRLWVSWDAFDIAGARSRYIVGTHG